MTDVKPGSGRGSRPDRPIPVPPSKMNAAKTQSPAVASSAPAGPTLPRELENSDHAQKARSSAPTTIDTDVPAAPSDQPSSPKQERHLESQAASAGPSPSPLQLQGHRRRPPEPTPVPSPPPTLTAAPFRPTPTLSPRAASAGLPPTHAPAQAPTHAPAQAPRDAASPPGSRIGDSARRLAAKSPRTFALAEITPELLASEAREDEQAHADRLVRAMRDAKEAAAATPPVPPRPGSHSSQLSQSAPSPRANLSSSLPSPSSSPSPPAPLSSSPPPLASPPPPAAPSPPPSAAPFVAPKKILPVPPKRAATATSLSASPPGSAEDITPGVPPSLRSQSGSGLSQSDGCVVAPPSPSSRSSADSAEGAASPPLSPAMHHEPKAGTKSERYTASTFRRIREKAKEGLEKTKEGLERTAKLKDAAVFQVRPDRGGAIMRSAQSGNVSPLFPF